MARPPDPVEIRGTSLNWCQFCGSYHFSGACPRIEEVEYYPDGAVKRVKFRNGNLSTTTITYGKEINSDSD